MQDLELVNGTEYEAVVSDNYELSTVIYKIGGS